MKKYFILLILTLVILSSIFAVGYTYKQNIKYVKAIEIIPTAALEKINYNGTIEYSDSKSVYASGSGIIQTVFFHNGDYVEKGDAVLSVCETSADVTSLLLGKLDSISSLLDGGTIKIYEAENSGIISGIISDSGKIFTKGQTLFKISNEDSYQLQFSVNEKDIPKIKKGQSVIVDCKALTDIFYAKISYIGDSAVQNGKITYVKVTADIDSPPPDLKSGYSADCSVIVNRKENILLVPYSCIVHDDEKDEDFVYISSNQKIQKQKITLGTEFSSGAEIISGIKEGDLVVYDAQKITDPQSTVINEVLVHE